MRTSVALPVVLAGSLALAGCFDGSSNSSPTTQVRVIHGVSDAPAVNVNIDGETSVPGADFRQAAIINPAVGTYSVSVDGILPDESTVPVINSTSLTFEEGVSYDIIASGSVGDETVAPIVLTDDGTRSDPDSARLRVVHLSPDAESAANGPVDVYVTSPEAALPAEPTLTFSFGEDRGPIEVEAGTYRIRVTPEDTPGTVVFDSGELPLPAGSDLIVGAIDNTLFGGAPAINRSPVNLLVVNGTNTTEIFSTNTGAGIRAAHNSADAGDVDVYLNPNPQDLSGPANVTALEYGETVPGQATTGMYQPLDIGPNRIAITPTGGTTAVIDETPDLTNGQLLTILAAGNMTQGIEPRIFSDDNRRIATAAKLRVIHGAIEASIVDVYLVPTAETGAGDTMLGNAEPALDNFEYGESSGYLEVAEDDYVIFITDTDGNLLFKSASLGLAPGGVYTAVARLNNDPASTATVTLLDDFVVPPS